MRREEIQPKSKQSVVLPSDLVEFLGYVRKMIEAKDELATIESDDLLQCERAYGGLIEEGGTQYGFTYFPEEETRYKWELELDITEITNIADGSKTDLVLWGCHNPNCRCMFSDPDDTCFYCDYADNS